MQNTNIQWTDHTLNFWWGCTKVSRACKHCYAETVAKVFGKRLFGTVPEWGAGKPRFERLEAARKEALKIQRQAVKSGTRPRVFVNSMSDWLDDEVPANCSRAPATTPSRRDDSFQVSCSKCHDACLFLKLGT